jgi:hypothetical protein
LSLRTPSLFAFLLSCSPPLQNQHTHGHGDMVGWAREFLEGYSEMTFMLNGQAFDGEV